MKKIFVLTLVFVLAAQIGLAQAAQGIHEPGTGLENPELMQENRGTGQGTQVQPEVTSQVQNQGATQPQLQNTQAAQVQNRAADGQGDGNANQQAVTRRSRVANAVQEMLQVADRSGGLGEQIRTVAQNQNRIQVEAEDALAAAQARGKFARFFIGPNYQQLKTVEDRLATHVQNMAELSQLRGQIRSTADQATLDQQLQIMEQIKQELENEVLADQKGFSLFGWLVKAFVK